MNTVAAPDLVAIRSAVGAVDDPEYPGVSIVDLGLLQTVAVDETGAVDVRLVPTFSGCPALGVIAADVTTAVAAVPGVTSVDVIWLTEPPWTIDRVSADGRQALAREFTVAVQVGAAAPRCPRCGGVTIEESMFGPSRCRAVNRCTGCGETVEVMRS